MGRVVSSLALVLIVGVVGWWNSARAGDAPPPPPQPTPIEALFLPVKEWL